MTAAIVIGQKERGTLHWLMVRRLFILGQDPPELARSERVSLDELADEFGEDLRAPLPHQIDARINRRCGSTNCASGIGFAIADHEM